MNTKRILLLPSVVALTLAWQGCQGTGPNTQRGAVGGAALGALVGAVIGNNSGSHNAASGAAIGAVAGGLAGGTLGNAKDHQQGTVYGSEQEATTDV
ncbi:MAG: glycine zipper domain-containing protein, partial [Oleiharenicola lentus]